MLVRQQVTFDSETVLLAESFSGLVAMELLRQGIPLHSVIFSASFASAPRPWLLKLADSLPLETLFRLPLPAPLLKILGQDASVIELLGRGSGGIAGVPLAPDCGGDAFTTGKAVEHPLSLFAGERGLGSSEAVCGSIAAVFCIRRDFPHRAFRAFSVAKPACGMCGGNSGDTWKAKFTKDTISLHNSCKAFSDNGRQYQ